MKVSCIKFKDDNKSFKFLKKIGVEVFEVEDREKTDDKIKELIENNYKTIILSNEISYFSEDIIKKYKKDDDINIIIFANNANLY